jgi:RNase P subunit RPR2
MDHRWNVGDRSKTTCTACRTLVTTTFSVRTLRFAHVALSAPDVLVVVCDRGGLIAGIPAQAAQQLQEALDRREVAGERPEE